MGAEAAAPRPPLFGRNPGKGQPKRIRLASERSDNWSLHIVLRDDFAVVWTDDATPPCAAIPCSCAGGSRPDPAARLRGARPDVRGRLGCRSRRLAPRRASPHRCRAGTRLVAPLPRAQALSALGAGRGLHIGRRAHGDQLDAGREQPDDAVRRSDGSGRLVRVDPGPAPGDRRLDGARRNRRARRLQGRVRLLGLLLDDADPHARVVLRRRSAHAPNRHASSRNESTRSSASGRSRPSVRRLRSARGSHASCTTSSRTRSR